MLLPPLPYPPYPLPRGFSNLSQFFSRLSNMTTYPSAIDCNALTRSRYICASIAARALTLCKFTFPPSLVEVFASVDVDVDSLFSSPSFPPEAFDLEVDLVSVEEVLGRWLNLSIASAREAWYLEVSLRAFSIFSRSSLRSFANIICTVTPKLLPSSICGICNPINLSNTRVCADPIASASLVTLYVDSTTSFAFSTSAWRDATKADSA
mmetsp:Transcript_26072/g.62635  ORF Transcript_26072/g.62635 Transcript_26072/m.62635 type:complete len:209 (+) Transcript_26072:244-870(+)